MKLIPILFLFISSFNCFAQYDNIHYVPPIHSRINTPIDLGPHYIFLSTNETTPFQVTITESNGTVLAVKSISRTNPDSLYLGSGGGNALGVIQFDPLTSHYGIF